MQMSDDVAEFFKWLTGEEFPGTDADKLRLLAQAYQGVSGGLEQVLPLFATAVNTISQGVEGRSEQAFVDAMRSYLGDDGFLGVASRYARRLGDGLWESASQVEYTQLMVILTAIELMLELAFALAVAWLFPGVLQSMLLRLLIGRFRISLWLARLLTIVMTSQVVGVGLQVLMDAIAQMILLRRGHQQGWNPKLTRSAAGVGAWTGLVGVAMGGAGGFLGGLGGRFLRDALRNVANETPGLGAVGRAAGRETTEEGFREGAEAGAGAGVGGQGLREGFVQNVLFEGAVEVVGEGTYNLLSGEKWKWSTAPATAVSGALSGGFEGVGDIAGTGLRRYTHGDGDSGDGSRINTRTNPRTDAYAAVDPPPLYSASPLPGETPLVSGGRPPGYQTAVVGSGLPDRLPPTGGDGGATGGFGLGSPQPNVDESGDDSAVVASKEQGNVLSSNGDVGLPVSRDSDSPEPMIHHDTALVFATQDTQTLHTSPTALAALPAREPAVTLGGMGSNPRTVPQTVHMVFAGVQPIETSTLLNVNAWRVRAGEQGWTLKVWADPPTVAAYPGLGATVLAETVHVGVGSADSIEFAVLNEHGGVLIDPDLPPTGISLPQQPIMMGTGADDPPYLGAAIRDEAELQAVIDRAVADGVALLDIDPALIRRNPDAMQVLHTYALESEGVSVVASPPGTSFLNALLTPGVSGPTESRFGPPHQNGGYGRFAELLERSVRGADEEQLRQAPDPVLAYHLEPTGWPEREASWTRRADPLSHHPEGTEDIVTARQARYPNGMPGLAEAAVVPAPQLSATRSVDPKLRQLVKQLPTWQGEADCLTRVTRILSGLGAYPLALDDQMTTTAQGLAAGLGGRFMPAKIAALADLPAGSLTPVWTQRPGDPQHVVMIYRPTSQPLGGSPSRVEKLILVETQADSEESRYEQFDPFAVDDHGLPDVPRTIRGPIQLPVDEQRQLLTVDVPSGVTSSGGPPVTKTEDLLVPALVDSSRTTGVGMNPFPPPPPPPAPTYFYDTSGNAFLATQLFSKSILQAPGRVIRSFDSVGSLGIPEFPAGFIRAASNPYFAHVLVGPQYGNGQTESYQPVPWNLNAPLYFLDPHGTWDTHLVTMEVLVQGTRRLQSTAFTGNEFGRYLRRRRSLQALSQQPGAQIVLLSCYMARQGTNGSIVAQQLANQTGLTVWAATEKVSIQYADGLFAMIISDTNTRGQWIAFHPQA